MNFLNATLIFGGIGVAIPIVIHLLSRRRPQRVIFPSIGLLKPKASLSQSRVRIKKWWLLALRIAALIFLALALAQPIIQTSLTSTSILISLLVLCGLSMLLLASLSVLRQMDRKLILGLTATACILLLGGIVWGIVSLIAGPTVTLNQNNPRAVVIFIDNGPTSAWLDQQGERLQQMKTHCEAFIQQLPASSQICVIDRATKNASFTIDQKNALTRIRQLDVVQSALPINQQLKTALQALETSKLDNHQILLLSDLTKHTWEPLLQSDEIQLSNSSGKVKFTIFDLGDFRGPNWGISLPRLADPSPPVGTPSPVMVSVFNESTDQSRDASITAELDIFNDQPGFPMARNGEVVFPKAEPVDRKSAQVKKGEQQEVLLNIPALPVGKHHGRIRIISDDAMPLDNTRYFSLNVLPPSNVLLVSNTPAASKVVANAIGVSSSLGTGSEYVTDLISYQDLPIVRMSQYEVVVLIDPPSNRQVNGLCDAYLKNGGQMLVSLGSRITMESDNSPWLSTEAIRWRSPEPGTFLQPIDIQHPTLRTLTENVPWGDHRIQQYWKLNPETSDNILIKYAGTDHPAVIERSIGGPSKSTSAQGRMILFTTPFPAISNDNKSWNQLFGSNAWPAWLLCRQTIEYLSQRVTTGADAVVGRSFAFQLQNEKKSNDDIQGFLFEPELDNPTPILGLKGGNYLRIREVSTAGTYWIRGKELKTGFSANLAENATRSRRIDISLLQEIFGTEEYDLIDNFENISFTETANKTYLPLHAPAILLVSIFFILEQIVGNRFYRGGSKSIDN